MLQCPTLYIYFSSQKLSSQRLVLKSPQKEAFKKLSMGFGINKFGQKIRTDLEKVLNYGYFWGFWPKLGYFSWNLFCSTVRAVKALTVNQRCQIWQFIAIWATFWTIWQSVFWFGNFKIWLLFGLLFNKIKKKWFRLVFSIILRAMM